MATEIQPTRPGVWRMAQPQGAKALGRLLGQSLDLAAQLMVPTDQSQGAAELVGQLPQPLPQLGGEGLTAVDEVAEHQHLARPEGLGQAHQPLQVRGASVAGQGDAVGLEHLRLAQVHIGQQEQLLLRVPYGALRQELKPMATPEEGLAGGRLAHAGPLAR